MREAINLFEERVPFFPKVIIFSAPGLVSLALARVVVIAPFSSNAKTRERFKALLTFLTLPNFLADFDLMISPKYVYTTI